MLAETLTRPQLASLLGVSTGTVARWSKIGAIPGPIPGTKRWSRAAVIERLRNGEKSPAAVELSPYDEWMASRGQRAT